MYEVPSNQPRRLSSVACFFRVFGWFSLLGLLLGGLYGLAIVLIFIRDTDDLLLGTYIGGFIGGIAGLFLGVTNGMITSFMVNKSTMTVHKLTKIYLGVMGLGFVVYALFMTGGDISQLPSSRNDWEAYLIFFVVPVIIASGCAVWIARRMMRWRGLQRA